MARSLYEAGQLPTGRDASGTYGSRCSGLRREQLRFGQVAPVMRILIAVTDGTAWRPPACRLSPSSHMETEASNEVCAQPSVGTRAVPYSQPSLAAGPSLTYITDACSALGSTKQRRHFVYPEFEPLAGSRIRWSPSVSPVTGCRPLLGMLARPGRVGPRCPHFEDAIALNRAMGASTWLAHAETRVRTHALARGNQEPGRVAALLGEAADTRRNRAEPTRPVIKALGSHIAPPASGRAVRARGAESSDSSLAD